MYISYSANFGLLALFLGADVNEVNASIVIFGAVPGAPLAMLGDVVEVIDSAQAPAAMKVLKYGDS